MPRNIIDDVSMAPKVAARSAEINISSCSQLFADVHS
jgi:hypothetical protein